MPKTSNVPPTLKPYQFHGVNIDYKEGEDDVYGDCPFCGKEGKLSVHVADGRWRCFVCNSGTETRGKLNRGGNSLTFLRMLWERSEETATAADYRALAADRKLLSPDTLIEWGVRKSFLTGEWVLPGWSVNGKLVTLYRYVGTPPTLYATPATDAGHGLHGVPLFPWVEEAGVEAPSARAGTTVYLAEGPWDAMVLWEVIGRAKEDKANVNLTTGKVVRGFDLAGSPSVSLLAAEAVLAVPSCSVFEPEWGRLLSGRKAVLLFDNDHPRYRCPPCNEGWSKTEGSHCPKCKRSSGLVETPAAGYEGMKRVATLLARATEPPASTSFLRWGKEGETFDPSLPSGFDVRDLLTDGGVAAGVAAKGKKPAPANVHLRLNHLSRLLGRVVPIPDDWVLGRTAAAKASGGSEIAALPTKSWKEVTQAWRKALKWIEGLDRALSCMLATILSTESQGDQLWMKIVGPPSCLHGNTPILDPVDGSVLTVAERWCKGAAFSVCTRLPSGSLGVAQALPPVRHPPAPMYRVEFRSGRKMTVTGGHRFWNGSDYVSCQRLCEELRRSGACPLPTISESVLSAQTRGVRRYSQTPEDSRLGYPAGPCFDGERPRWGEADDRDTLPSPLGVRGLSAHPSKSSRIRRNQPTSPYSWGAPAPAAVVAGEARPLVSGGNDEPLSRWYRTGDYTLMCRPLIGTSQRGPGSPPLSSSSQTELLGWREPYRRAPGLLEEPARPDAENNPIRKDRDNAGSSLPASQLSPPDASSPPPDGDISGASPTQPLEFGSTPQWSFQIDTTQQPADDVPGTKGQPLFFSVRPVREIGDERILTEIDEIVKIEPAGEAPYYDFHVPLTNNYWAEGLFHHNCGKSELCESLSAAKEYVFPKDTISGLFSGYQVDREGSENLSLALRLKNKTLVIKDGDTLLQMPNLLQILSQFRSLYDRAFRTSYRNKMSGDHEGLNITFLLCGTESLRLLDSSELGERLLDCVIADKIPPDLEDEIALRKAFQADRELSFRSDGKAETRLSPEKLKATQLTAGYINYLRQNAQELLDGVVATEEDLRRCVAFGTFVAFMRSRPSKRQEEVAQRELSYRLVSQHVRLAKCLAVVYNRTTLDEYVMKRTRQVSLDTSRGRIYELARLLYAAGERGADTPALAARTGHTEDKERALLKHLFLIGGVELFRPLEPSPNGEKLGKPRWRLTERLRRVYAEVVEGVSPPPPAEEEPEYAEEEV